MSAIVSDPSGHVVVAQRNRTDVSWGAIFAGWVLAYGVAWLLYLLGSAIGVSAISFTEESIAEGLGWGTIIWVFITWAISMFLGGLFAAWLTGNPDRSIGALHGLAVWAVGTLFGLVIAGMSAVNVFQSGQSLLPDASVGQLMTATTQMNGQQMNDMNPAMSQVGTALQAELKQALSSGIARSTANAPGGGATVSREEVRRSIEELQPAVLATIAAQLVQDDTEAAKNTLVVNTPLSRAEVDRIIEGMSASVQQMQQRVEQAADQAAKYSAAALWALFVSSVLGLLMCAWGGWAGSRHVARRLGYAGERY
ncbi:MAG TPA: hypothetical protein VIR60_10015 [Gammaproteobacteria bacterium]